MLPTEIILFILQKKLEDEKKDDAHRFLIDGFLRQLAQEIEFEKQIKSCSNQSDFASYEVVD